MEFGARNETVTLMALAAEQSAAAAGPGRMARAALLAAVILAAAAVADGAKFSRSRAVVGEDGGYSGVTVRIADDVPEEDCADILRNLKVGRKERGTTHNCRGQMSCGTCGVVIGHYCIVLLETAHVKPNSGFKSQ